MFFACSMYNESIFILLYFRKEKGLTWNRQFLAWLQKGELTNLFKYNYSHSKFSLPAPTSKWYLPMPKSIPEKRPLLQVMETLLPTPLTIYACLFKAVGAYSNASTPSINHWGAMPLYWLISAADLDLCWAPWVWP